MIVRIIYGLIMVPAWALDPSTRGMLYNPWWERRIPNPVTSKVLTPDPHTGLVEIGIDFIRTASGLITPASVREDDDLRPYGVGEKRYRLSVAPKELGAMLFLVETPQGSPAIFI